MTGQVAHRNCLKRGQFRPGPRRGQMPDAAPMV
jgi:hypothetical protein